MERTCSLQASGVTERHQDFPIDKHDVASEHKVLILDHVVVMRSHDVQNRYGLHLTNLQGGALPRAPRLTVSPGTLAREVMAQGSMHLGAVEQ